MTYFTVDVGQYCEYALDSDYVKVLNMLGLHKILNKILYHRISQGSEYALSSEYASVTQGSVENGPS